MKITKSNLDIYIMHEKFDTAFKEENRIFPAKVYFYILKNMKAIQAIKQEIDSSRDYVIKKYGHEHEDGTYHIDSENMIIVNKELEELEQINQEIDISMIKLADIEELEFTPAQMEALMFMIEE